MILLVISWIFYNNFIVAIVLSPYLFFFIRSKLKETIRKHREKLSLAFKDGMEAVTSALIAGYSIENAFRESLSELILLYGKKSLIYKSFAEISNKLSLNVPIEEAFDEFAVESQIEEIQVFSQVLSYARVSGGNLVTIIKNTSQTIGEKIEVKREIATIISAKKLEQTIMNYMPIGIVVYMRVTSGDMFGVLYQNAFGAIIMSFCLCIYVVARVIANKIIDIKV